MMHDVTFYVYLQCVVWDILLEIITKNYLVANIPNIRYNYYKILNFCGNKMKSCGTFKCNMVMGGVKNRIYTDSYYNNNNITCFILNLYPRFHKNV